MTGNVGRPGGSAGGGLMGIPIGHMFRMSAIPPGKNPVELDGPKVKGTLDIRLREATGVPVNLAEDPTTCVVMGSGKVLEESLDVLKKVVVGEKEYF